MKKAFPAEMCVTQLSLSLTRTGSPHPFSLHLSSIITHTYSALALELMNSLHLFIICAGEDTLASAVFGHVFLPLFPYSCPSTLQDTKANKLLG